LCPIPLAGGESSRAIGHSPGAKHARALTSAASAPESAQRPRDESSLLASHWRSEAEGNCVVERRGGEQPEANSQSVNKMLNSIRPTALTSLLAKDEVWNRMPSQEARRLRRPLLHRASDRRTNGKQRVVGDRMVGRRCEVNQGTRSGNSDGVHGRQRPEEPCPEGDRASVGAKKRGNARGAKGGRDVEAGEPKRGSTKAGVVPERADRARDKEPPVQKAMPACLWSKEGERTLRCQTTFSSGGLTDDRKNRVSP
jgi:hypothetical protein